VNKGRLLLGSLNLLGGSSGGTWFGWL
jgi:hypothetical protein